ncbi:NAD(P)-dependent oxidoreductase, partial [Roseibium hamelinense]
HCALLHAPGRYRGGEGDDPEQFWAANAIGTERLFEAAKASGIRCVVFLSSRAVYGDAYRNRQLAEDMDAKPDTLYGRVKLAGEQALASLADHRMHGVSLRATGVYGCSPGLAGHKWSDLFRSFENGEPIASRCGTEVHGEDLASAVRLVLEKAEDLPAFSAFNVSDIMLDRHDLLARFAQGRSLRARPPQPVQGDYPAVMDCSRLRALGWSPGGFEKLASFLQNL